MPGQERGRRASFRRSLVGIVALLVLNGALVRCSLSPRLPRSSSPNRPFSLIAPSAETLPAPTVLPSPAPFSPSLTVWLPQVAVRATRPATPLYTYRVVRQYPHDPEAFTQGLVYLDGLLYESTGLYGRSSVRQVELETGRVLQRNNLGPTYFGEGMTIWGKRMLQLTWKSGRGFIYDRDTLALLDQFTYSGEGWGLTHDGRRLIISDGTSSLRFWDPQTLAEIGQVSVHDEQGPVERLNELEYVRGEVYANVWLTDRIARIDAQSGRVLGWVDLTGLLSPEDRQRPVDVLNGIAYDAAGDRLFVTGKLWPKLFQIELVPAGPQ